MAQELYDLPEGWEWKSVSDLSHRIQYGHTAKASESGNVGFLRITDIQDSEVNWDSVPKVSVSANDAEKYQLNENDIVFVRSGATSGKSFLLKAAPKDTVFASYLIRIIPNIKSVSAEYLYSYFQSPEYWDQVRDNVSGAAQPNINGKKLGNFQIPVPPLAEQERIVGRFDALFSRIDQTIAQLKHTQAQTQALWASALDAAFGSLRPRVLVKDLARKIQYGHTAKASEVGNVGFLRITDIQKNEVDWTSIPKVKVSSQDAKKYQLLKNDIVFARSGATSGKSFLIRECPIDTIFASYLIRVVPDISKLNPEYLYLYFQSPEYWDQVRANSAGAAQPNINGKKLGEFQIPLPPLPEQAKIVTQLDALSERTQALAATTTRQLDQLTALKASLLDAAFRGQL